jgi:putative oxidoreductase
MPVAAKGFGPSISETPPPARHLIEHPFERRRTTMNQILKTGVNLWRLTTRIGNALDWLPPSLARLTVGWIFFQSGWGKLHDLAKVTDYFIQLGLPAPAFQARLTATTEFACGALLLLGLCTRFAVVPLTITMIVAIRTALWDQVDSLGSLFGLAEFLYITLLVWLGTNGAGPLSLDHLIEGLIERRGQQDAHTTLVRGRPSSVAA